MGWLDGKRALVAGAGSGIGRAVIGGLCFATVATLFFVPVFFTIVHGGKKDHRPPPIHPALRED